MTTDNKEKWILKGYEHFALEGLSGLKIEPIANEVGISKSSFYHHFGDIECFIELLLKHHIERSLVISKKERNAAIIDPDLINIIIEHKIDFLFNKQLRINSNHKLFPETLEHSNQVVGDLFSMRWVNDINQKLTKNQTEAILQLVIENFFLQITNNNINYNWLAEYFKNLKSITDKFV
jgi:AcrR family transcriptional regulator